ncbi:MAG: lysophospholipid acyltransferase family protein [Oligoflexus sp.]
MKRRLTLWLSQFLVTLFHWTYRYRVVNPQFHATAEAMHPNGSLCIASWHQNCFAGILGHAKKGFTILVSRSFDGEIISHVANKIGVASVRGSSSKGGQEALQELIKRTPDGLKSAITVDGPRGPAYQVKSGILRLAAETGAAILPTMAIGDRYWTLSRSWDRFRLPKPFAKVFVVYGEPFQVSKEELASDSEGLKQKVQQSLHELEKYLPQKLSTETFQRVQQERESLVSLVSGRGTVLTADRLG